MNSCDGPFPPTREVLRAMSGRALQPGDQEKKGRAGAAAFGRSAVANYSMHVVPVAQSHS